MQDKGNGGFYGLVDYNLRIHKQEEKGSIALSRFLWSFSAAYRVTKNEEFYRPHTMRINFYPPRWLILNLAGSTGLSTTKGM
ncbi:hypothetical protein [Paenibacillus selenitireducens]|uniref:hypothetical protein n=1 Tax=Paenibacillus selenitireducens TaxID=1324314 RepID=UPI002FCDE738